MKKISYFGVDAIGKIASYEKDNEGYKTPVIEFTSDSGEFIKATPVIYGSTDLSKIRTYKSMIDKEVKIKYDPENPGKFVVVGDNPFNYIILIALFIVGSAFIIISVLSLSGYSDMFS